jgi:hypothetical protein
MKTVSQLTEGITPLPPFDQQVADLEAFRADSQALAGLIGQLEKALPNFKGLPAPVDWARMALQKVVEDRKALIEAMEVIIGIKFDSHNDGDYRETALKIVAEEAAHNAKAMS